MPVALPDDTVTRLIRQDSVPVVAITREGQLLVIRRCALRYPGYERDSDLDRVATAAASLLVRLGLDDVYLWDGEPDPDAILRHLATGGQLGTCPGAAARVAL